MHRSLSLGHTLKPHHRSSENNNTNDKLKTLDEETHRLAVSQPLLNSTSPNERQRLKRAGSGVMYRPDVFYHGSLHNLDLRRCTVSDIAINKSQYGSMHAVTDKPADLDYDEKHTVCKCIPCSKETKDTLRQMMHFGLLRDPVFIIFAVSNFLTSIGFNIPYVYIAAQADVLGFTSEQGSYLLSIIGIANTVGRIILGYVSDKTWVNRLLVYNIF